MRGAVLGSTNGSNIARRRRRRQTDKKGVLTAVSLGRRELSVQGKFEKWLRAMTLGLWSFIRSPSS